MAYFVAIASAINLLCYFYSCCCTLVTYCYTGKYSQTVKSLCPRSVQWRLLRCQIDAAVLNCSNESKRSKGVTITQSEEVGCWIIYVWKVVLPVSYVLTGNLLTGKLPATNITGNSEAKASVPGASNKLGEW